MWLATFVSPDMFMHQFLLLLVVWCAISSATAIILSLYNFPTQEVQFYAFSHKTRADGVTQNLEPDSDLVSCLRTIWHRMYCTVSSGRSTVCVNIMLLFFPLLVQLIPCIDTLLSFCPPPAGAGLMGVPVWRPCCPAAGAGLQADPPAAELPGAVGCMAGWCRLPSPKALPAQPCFP